MSKFKTLELCQDPDHFTRLDCHEVRQIAHKLYLETPASDGFRERDPGELNALVWAKAVITYLKYHGWEVTRKQD